MKHDVAKACSDELSRCDQAAKDLSINVFDVVEGSCRARMTITNSMLNGVSVCHGGVLFTLADTAFQHACNSYNDLTVAANGSIDFLKPAMLGDVITASCQEVKRGRSSGIYDVTLTNQNQQTIAIFRGRSASTHKPLIS